jgi:Zn-dependent protease
MEGKVMPKQTIPLGRIFNIPIGLDYSWFLIFILLTWSLASSYYPAEFRNWSTVQYWAVGAITAILLFASVLLHELGHSLIALRYKIPVRSITLFIFGGVAQIAAEPPSASAEFWIAIAGPVVSFTLAALLTLAQPFSAGFSPLFALVKYMAYLNGTLGLFNLIPGFPLDGGRVFRAIVWGLTHSLHRATIVAATVGRIIAYGFILVGVWQMFSGNFVGGLWIAFIGWFLETAASSQVHQQALHELLGGQTVAQAMDHDFSIVPAGTTLQELADRYILGEGKRFFIVESAGRAVGMVTLKKIKDISREDWPHTTADQVMTSVDSLHLLQPDTQLWEAIQAMDLDDVGQEPVISHGEIQGVLSREDIRRFVRTLRELNYSH